MKTDTGKLLYQFKKYIKYEDIENLREGLEEIRLQIHKGFVDKCNTGEIKTEKIDSYALSDLMNLHNEVSILSNIIGLESRVMKSDNKEETLKHLIEMLEDM